MHLQGDIIKTQKIYPRERTHSRKRHVSHSLLKRAGKVNFNRIKRHALAFMDSNCPREPQWNLSDFGKRPAIFFNTPSFRRRNNFIAVKSNNYRKTGIIKTRHLPQCAVNKSFVKIIFYEHHFRALFNYQSFRSKASFFQGF